jgi:Flp pilus assembly protein TadG
VTRRHHLLPDLTRRRRLIRRGESGAAAVEFALVVGLFVFILYGLISFGMILATKQRITNAAAEGARAAVGSSQADAALVAGAKVTNALGTSSGQYTAIYDNDACPLVLGHKCIKVTITYNLNTHPVVPPAPGLHLVTPPTISSTAVVQYS